MAATERSISSVSVAPQIPVRRIFAFSTIARAICGICLLMNIGVTNAFQMREHGYTRFCLHARDQSFPATRNEHVDRAAKTSEHMADRGTISRRHKLDRSWR